MGNFSSRREREEMQELLKSFHNLKSGRSASFLQEEDFERIIDYYDDKEELPNALQAAEIGMEQFPFAAQLMFKKADLLIALQRYKEALDVLDTAAVYDQTDVSLYILKTDVYLALEQPEKAARILEEALERFDGDDRIELLFELADVYDDYEDFQKVFDCMKLILEEDPNNEEALLKICFWADFTGRSEESIRLHQWIIEEHPFNELAWFNLATAYQGIKLYEKSIDAYQYALAIDDKLDIAYRNMGDALIRLRKYKEAIESLERALELSRPEDVLYEAIGHCYHKMENWALARFNYRKASHLNPDDSRIFYKLALTYYREGKWESCMKQLETAMKVHKSQAEYHQLMGDTLMELHKLKEASACYLHVIKLKPKNISGHEALIRCLMQAGYFEDALSHSQKAYEISRQNPVFLYFNSAILFGLQKSKEALFQLETALRIHPQGFKKMIDLVPGVLQKTPVLDLVNRYVKKKKGRS